jgi:RNA polymerase sigma factor (TIGR02999 family)
LFDLVWPDLRRLAAYLMRRERPGHTLTATALLNETYLRLAGARDHDWQDRRHFFAMAARAMRRFLIDYARAHPKAARVDLDSGVGLPERATSLETAVTVDGALEELRAAHPDLAAIVELKFFLGMTDTEAAEALGWPVRTAQRRWHDARAWLYERLAGAV